MDNPPPRSKSLRDYVHVPTIGWLDFVEAQRVNEAEDHSNMVHVRLWTLREERLRHSHLDQLLNDLFREGFVDWKAQGANRLTVRI